MGISVTKSRAIKDHMCDGPCHIKQHSRSADVIGGSHMDVQPWEREAKESLDTLSKILRENGVKSRNIDIIFDRMMDLRLRLAYQTGNYDFWGI